MAAAGVIQHLSIPQSRARRMQEELRFALGQVSKAELAAWGVASGGRFGVGIWRRGKSLYSIAKRAGKFTISEVREGLQAGQEHRFGDHSKERGKQLVKAGGQALSWAKVKAQGLPEVARALKDHPAETAPRLLGATIGFLTGSGGLDANGGVLSPDVDLLFGIGAHRSVLTHSLILGAAAEATILSAVELSKLVHKKLPANHDVIWDHLASHGQNFALGLATGYGVGLAYHLGVDATVQAAPLHGIPVPMPMEAHQAVMLGSAVAEVSHERTGQQTSSSDSREGSKRTSEVLRVAEMVRDGKLSPDDAVELVESLSIAQADAPDTYDPEQEPEPIRVGSSTGVAFDIAPTPPRPRRVRVSAVREAEEQARNRVPRPPIPPSTSGSIQSVDLGEAAQNILASGAAITVGLATYPLIGPGGTVLGLGTFHLLRRRR